MFLHLVATEKTELLTYGFAREAESLLNELRIPKAIIDVILLLIENYYRNYGEYIWKIDDPQKLKEISAAKEDEVFESPEFIMAKMKWKLVLYQRPVPMYDNAVSFTVAFIIII